MCEDIVRYAGIEDYTVKKFPEKADGDLAILLSESDTELESIKIKINTFPQIKKSIEEVSKYSERKIDLESIFEDCPIAIKYLRKTPKNSTRVKVYSNFLKDIAEDMGFEIVQENQDFTIAPDYMADNVEEDVIIIPSHSNISTNPLKKASIRYKILEDYINYKL